MENFSACFGDVVDPRRDNARHDLHELLVIALCAMLCGGEDCTDMALFGQAKEDFLRRFLRLRHGIPSHDTFSRLFRDLDPASFHAAFQSFMAQFSTGLSEVIAIDGKTLRRSFDHASAKSPLHLVSAWASEQRLVLGQIAVDGKSNEITAVPKLLELLTLKGRIVTLDAMHCQRVTAAAISEVPRRAAVTRSLPNSRYRWIFSRTRMELLTRIPTERASPIMLMTLIE